MFWHFIQIIFIFFVSIIAYYAIKFRNPYKLLMVFGAKGSGKTTLLTKLAYQHARKKWNVYSTVPVPGAHLIQPSDIGHSSIPSHSVILDVYKRQLHCSEKLCGKRRKRFLHFPDLCNIITINLFFIA